MDKDDASASHLILKYIFYKNKHKNKKIVLAISASESSCQIVIERKTWNLK